MSKSLDVHERFFIPWFDLYKCNIENFRNYRTYLISKEDYKISREKRISFLESLNLPVEDASRYVLVEYTEIPNFIWLDVIKNLIKELPNMEEELLSASFREFAISGHTEEKRFLPWQMFDKSRYELIKRL